MRTSCRPPTYARTRTCTRNTQTAASRCPPPTTHSGAAHAWTLSPNDDVDCNSLYCHPPMSDMSRSSSCPLSETLMSHLSLARAVKYDDVEDAFHPLTLMLTLMLVKDDAPRRRRLFAAAAPWPIVVQGGSAGRSSLQALGLCGLWQRCHTSHSSTRHGPCHTGRSVI